MYSFSAEEIKSINKAYVFLQATTMKVMSHKIQESLNAFNAPIQELIAYKLKISRESRVANAFEFIATIKREKLIDIIAFRKIKPFKMYFWMKLVHCLKAIYPRLTLNDYGRRKLDEPIVRRYLPDFSGKIDQLEVGEELSKLVIGTMNVLKRVGVSRKECVNFLSTLSADQLTYLVKDRSFKGFIEIFLCEAFPSAKSVINNCRNLFKKALDEKKWHIFASAFSFPTSNTSDPDTFVYFNANNQNETLIEEPVQSPEILSPSAFLRKHSPPNYNLDEDALNDNEIGANASKKIKYNHRYFFANSPPKQVEKENEIDESKDKTFIAVKLFFKEEQSQPKNKQTDSSNVPSGNNRC